MLIGILLPALSRAREQANRSACAANLRSILQANATYIHDRKRLATWSDTSFIAIWNGTDYVEYGQLIAEGTTDKRLFRCPSSWCGVFDDAAYGLDNVGVAGRTAVTFYAQRGRIDGAPRTTVDMVQMKSLLFDLGGDVSFTVGGTPVTANFRTHPGGVNAAYTDGHVSFITGTFAVDPANTPAVWAALDAATQ